MKTILIEIKNTIIAIIVFGVICCVIYPLAVYGIGQLLFSHQANGSLIQGKDGKIVGSELLGQSFSGEKYFHPRPSAAGTGYDASSSSGSNLGPTSKKLINGTTKSIMVPAKDANGKPVTAPDVVDYDGLKIRIITYCDENSLPYQLLQDDKVVDPKTFKTDKGDYDQVKLITAFNDDAKPLTIKPAILIPGDAITASGSGLDPHISPKNARIQIARVANARKLEPEKVQELVEQCTDKPFLGIIGDPGVNVLKLNLTLDGLSVK